MIFGKILERCHGVWRAGVRRPLSKLPPPLARACVRACVHACVRARARACACVRARARVCGAVAIMSRRRARARVCNIKIFLEFFANLLI